MDIIGSFSVVTTFLLIFLGIFLLTHKKGGRTSNRILSAFLLCNALYILNYLLFHYKILSAAKFAYIGQVGRSLYLLMWSG